MNVIEERYNLLCSIPSDINEHLPTLYRYALQCKHITEFGVRFGISTWAFLAANPDKLKAYDFCRYDEIQQIEDVASNFEFNEMDVLDVDIENTDLLFIDTFHHPLQLKRELNRHHQMVNKYIILHDTEANKRRNGSLWPDEIEAMLARGNDPNEYIIYPNVGVHATIIDFLYEHRDWYIKEVFSNNNGLTVLEHALE